MFINFWPKLIVSSSLFFLGWLTIQCPCTRMLCCHLGTFWGVLAVALAVVLYENHGFKLVDKTCW